MVSLFKQAWEAFGPLDVLVNNAGVYRFGNIEDVTEDEFHRQFNINVLGPILAAREAVKYFSPDGGSVINVSSVASELGMPSTRGLFGDQGRARRRHPRARPTSSPRARSGSTPSRRAGWRPRARTPWA